jgi:hypothetical protein
MNMTTPTNAEARQFFAADQDYFVEAQGAIPQDRQQAVS